MTVYRLVVQTVSLVESLLMPGGFVGGRLRKLKLSDLSWVLLNLAESSVLAVVPLLSRQCGFAARRGPGRKRLST